MPDGGGSTAPPPGHRPRPAALFAALVPAFLLLAFLVTQYAGGWTASFINEDWAFLDLTRGKSLLGFWTDPALYSGPWLRPWSQGFHYWALQALFGTRVEAWHVVSAVLALLSLLLYFGFVRRVSGTSAAGVATACVAALAAWGVPMRWVAGVQDLWMVACSLLALHLWSRERRGWAVVTLLVGLLSKETAAVVPALIVAQDVVLERRRLRDALVRSRLLWGTLAAWAVIHPAIGGRWWHHAASAPGAERGMSAGEAAWRALLAVVNLDVRPEPEPGWRSAASLAILGFLPLLLLVLWCRREPARSGGRSSPVEGIEVPRRDTRSVAGFGVTWAVLGWLPLLLPSLHWHSYYSLFGSMGAWLALGAIAGRRPALAIALVLGLAGLRAGRSTTALEDWGEESYVRRAAQRLDALRADLLARCPAPAAFTRFYFTDVPAGSGFLVGDGPALRVWYSDRTLEGRFYRDFVARAPSSHAGADRFFRWDAHRGWIEIRVGAEPVDAARREDPAWAADHERLARTLTQGGDWTAAYAEYAKLAGALPDSVEFAYRAGLGAIAAGDSVAAARWLARAAEHPAADSEMRAVARAYARPAARPIPSR